MTIGYSVRRFASVHEAVAQTIPTRIRVQTELGAPSFDIVFLMRARFAQRAVLLAWGIGVGCPIGIAAGLILLTLDWRAIDSPSTALLDLNHSLPWRAAVHSLSRTTGSSPDPHENERPPARYQGSLSGRE